MGARVAVCSSSLQGGDARQHRRETLGKEVSRLDNVLSLDFVHGFEQFLEVIHRVLQVSKRAITDAWYARVAEEIPEAVPQGEI